MKRSSLFVACSISCAVACLNCAYSFKGFTVRDVDSIAIPVFENKTIKFGLEETLTKSVIDAFIEDNRLKVLDKGSAESILLGEITTYTRKPFSYDDQENVKDYKITLQMKLAYKDKEGKSLSDKQITDWHLYSSQETEEQGMDGLCKKLADDIVRGILEGW